MSRRATLRAIWRRRRGSSAASRREGRSRGRGRSPRRRRRGARSLRCFPIRASAICRRSSSRGFPKGATRSSSRAGDAGERLRTRERGTLDAAPGSAYLLLKESPVMSAPVRSPLPRTIITVPARVRHLLLGLALLALGVSPALAVHSLPPGFDDPAVFSGLNHPMAIRFASDGRIFVAEKRGVIKVFQGLTDTTPDIFADFQTNVHDFWDRGLLGMALDPNFPAQPYVYVLYTYDYDFNTPSIPPPRWGAACNGSPSGPGATIDGCVVSGRLSRLQISPSNTMVGPETVLIENQWCQQFPSHSLGALNFAPDGSLYVEAGDGASFETEDYGQLGGTIG